MNIYKLFLPSTKKEEFPLSHSILSKNDDLSSEESFRSSGGTWLSHLIFFRKTWNLAFRFRLFLVLRVSKTNIFT